MPTSRWFSRVIPDDPDCTETKEALKKLLVTGEDSIYCQPCVSPVWDTAIAAHAVFEANGKRASASIRRALNWLQERQLSDEPGDWRETRPDLKGGGWAFQYANPHYPDLDDTSMVGWAMCLIDPQRYKWLTQCRGRMGLMGCDQTVAMAPSTPTTPITI